MSEVEQRAGLLLQTDNVNINKRQNVKPKLDYLTKMGKLKHNKNMRHRETGTRNLDHDTRNT